MKTLGFFLLFICGAFSARAQLFTPESFHGALLGGLAGGIIGHNTSDRGAEGAAIGAATGWLLGSLAHQSRRRQAESASVVYGPTYPYVAAPAEPAQTAQASVHNVVKPPPVRPNPMAGANRLFGR